jgi:hypothetical protein
MPRRRLAPGQEQPKTYPLGTEVIVCYTGYTVKGTIVERDDRGNRSDDTWAIVRQDSDYEDASEEDRPVYQALWEHISLPGEPLGLTPLAVLARAMGYHLGDS